MRKPILLVIVLIFLVVGVLYVGTYVARYLPGTLPLLQKSPLDIADVIRNQDDERDGEMLPLLIPPGFSISIFSDGLNAPRDITRDRAGNIIVSIPKEGRVLALPDRDGDGIADEHVTVIEGLNRPHGLAIFCESDQFGIEELCYLYIAETDKVVRYKYDQQELKAFAGEKILDLPGGGNHFTRSLLFTTRPSVEGSAPILLTSVGSSCNVCNEDDKRRAAILASNPDGSDTEIYAFGLRNAVFLARHPVTGDVWVTDNGRDLLGDDIPPDEINIVREGGNYGWPLCYGKNVADFDFIGDVQFIRAPCSLPFETPSHIDIQAHSAPLGLSFIPPRGWPEEYWYDLLVAYHGSWNRSVPTGYKVVRFRLDENGVLKGREDFITGWLREDGSVLGRPVDIMVEPGGVMYITDDRAGVVYRLQRK